MIINIFLSSIKDLYVEILSLPERRCPNRTAQMIRLSIIPSILQIKQDSINIKDSEQIIRIGTYFFWEIVYTCITLGARKSVAQRYVDYNTGTVANFTYLEMPQALIPFKKNLTWMRLLDLNMPFMEDDDHDFIIESYKKYCELRSEMSQMTSDECILFIAQHTAFLIPYIKFQCEERDSLKTLQPFLDLLKHHNNLHKEHATSVIRDQNF
jgi:hypothetical protein